MNKIMNFFVGLLVGGLIGATVVILVTPASGEEIRGQIQERSIQLKDEIKAVADARRAELERELAALRAPYKSQ
jgi:gas vesicle protein